MRIKIEDYFGNDILELKLKKIQQRQGEFLNYEDNIFYREGIDIKETDEYNIADVDEDENGEYVRVQLNTSTTMYKLNK